MPNTNLKCWEDILMEVILRGYYGASWDECQVLRLLNGSFNQRLSEELTVLDARAYKHRVRLGKKGSSTIESALIDMPAFPKLEWLELDYLRKNIEKGGGESYGRQFEFRLQLLGSGLRCLSLRDPAEAVNSSQLRDIGKFCTKLEVLDISIPMFIKKGSAPTDPGVKNFGSTLGNLSELRFLDLSCTCILDATLEKALVKLKHLSHLGLRSCRNLNSGVLVHISRHTAKTLKVLDISDLSDVSDADMSSFVNRTFDDILEKEEKETRWERGKGEMVVVEGPVEDEISKSSSRSQGSHVEKDVAWPSLFCVMASFLKDLNSESILALLSINSLRILDMRGLSRLVDAEVYKEATKRDVITLFKNEDVYQEKAACLGKFWPPSMLAFRPKPSFVRG